MTKANGDFGRVLDEVVSAHDAALEEARERVIAAEVRVRLAQELHKRASVPVRSKMSARAKSDYITAHGKAAYDQLPWGD
jgi:hypothetical protein